jgi:hypothetical protein
MAKGWCLAPSSGPPGHLLPRGEKGGGRASFSLDAAQTFSPTTRKTLSRARAFPSPTYAQNPLPRCRENPLPPAGEGGAIAPGEGDRPQTPTLST